VTLKQKAQYPLDKLSAAIQAVPVRVKIAGIVMLQYLFLVFRSITGLRPDFQIGFPTCCSTSVNK
jgi:hypothetical protein